jgi:hypothetical protein
LLVCGGKVVESQRRRHLLRAPPLAAGVVLRGRCCEGTAGLVGECVSPSIDLFHGGRQVIPAGAMDGALDGCRPGERRGTYRWSDPWRVSAVGVRLRLRLEHEIPVGSRGQSQLSVLESVCGSYSICRVGFARRGLHFPSKGLAELNRMKMCSPRVRRRQENMDIFGCVPRVLSFPLPLYVFYSTINSPQKKGKVVNTAGFTIHRPTMLHLRAIFYESKLRAYIEIMGRF